MMIKHDLELSDLWPWKPFQQCSITRWTFVPSFITIRPLHRVIASREIDVNRMKTHERTAGRTTVKHNASTACCWRRGHKNTGEFTGLLKKVDITLFMAGYAITLTPKQTVHAFNYAFHTCYSVSNVTMLNIYDTIQLDRKTQHNRHG